MNILKVLTNKRKIGNVGERAAISYIRKRGYKVVETNYVALGHEVDIIAYDKDTLVFIEVKTRTQQNSSYESRPSAAVTRQKMRAIIKVAGFYTAYLSEKPSIRFDVIEVYLDKNENILQIQQLEAAFTKDRAISRR